uniref:Uncharacterized protein n=1 Tax=Glossina palpalis gambiensis TaxID=67801 RepID=A0A1B0C229_9MUSC
MFQHGTDCNGAGSKDVMELPLANEMHCICGFSTANGNKMAHHLAACGHKSAYPSLETAQENTVKRNMLDMLGLVKRDGEQGNENDVNDSNQPQEESGSVQTDLSVATVDESNVTETLQPPPEPMDTDTATLADATPIQFGQMDAAPQQHVAATTAAAAGSQHYAHIVDNSSHLQTGHTHAQYHLGFGQAEVAGHTLNAADIDMPLIGELADPNPPPTPQFLGEVHTPMFDAVAAAEQQHYHQLMQQQHLQQHSHHHGAQ